MVGSAGTADELAVRRRLYELAVDVPGSSAPELQRAAALPFPTVVAQLLRLEEAGHLRRERGPEKEFYFAVSVGPGDPQVRALRSSPEARDLLLALLARPDAPEQALAGLLRRGEATTRALLRALVAAGAVARSEGPSGSTFRIADRRRAGQIVVGRPPAARFDLGDGALGTWGEMFPPG